MAHEVAPSLAPESWERALHARRALRNIGATLSWSGAHFGSQLAVAAPLSNGSYRTATFAELDRDSNRVASSLTAQGLRPGMRIALLVPPSWEFLVLVFALFKAGAVIILIDPGMGRANMLRCLAEAEPEGMVAISLAQAVRCLLRRRFPRLRLVATVGRRWFWGGSTLPQLLAQGTDTFPVPTNDIDEPAAIIFTTGSTGPPKGVLYRHRNFLQQVEQIQAEYHVRPGEIDLPGFPLFGLFNAAMGVTTIIPEMDPTRPAAVDPVKILRAADRWHVTQSFGSPAMWNTISRYCEQQGAKFSTLRRVLSAGAPVPPHVMKRLLGALPAGAEMYTPYGATEALPVATISAADILGETAARTNQGAGTCVGRSFPGIRWQVIRIQDGPLATLADAEVLPVGQVGELIVSGPVVTSEYVTRREANATAKIRDGEHFWHRMGDIGYLDEQQRFWFCGRKSHRVQTAWGDMYTDPVEAIFNRHPQVYRSALVGTGPAGQQLPAVICEPWPEHRPTTPAAERQLLDELYELGQSHPLTHRIARARMAWQSALPVDIRHNAKIFREKLAVWAATHLPAAADSSE